MPMKMTMRTMMLLNCVALACGCQPKESGPHIRDVIAWDQNEAIVICYTGKDYQVARSKASGDQELLFTSDLPLNAVVSGSRLDKFMFAEVNADQGSLRYYYGDSVGIVDLEMALDYPERVLPLAFFPEHEMMIGLLPLGKYVLMSVIRNGDKLMTGDVVRLENLPRSISDVSEPRSVGDGTYIAVAGNDLEPVPKFVHLISLHPEVKELASLDLFARTIYGLHWLDDSHLLLRSNSGDPDVPAAFHRIDVDMSIDPPELSCVQVDLGWHVEEFKKDKAEHMDITVDWILTGTAKSGVHVMSLNNLKRMRVPSTTGTRTSSFNALSLRENILMVQTGLSTLSFYELGHMEVVKISEIVLRKAEM